MDDKVRLVGHLWPMDRQLLERHVMDHADAANNAIHIEICYSLATLGTVTADSGHRHQMDIMHKVRQIV